MFATTCVFYEMCLLKALTSVMQYRLESYTMSERQYALDSGQHRRDGTTLCRIASIVGLDVLAILYNYLNYAHPDTMYINNVPWFGQVLGVLMAHKMVMMLFDVQQLVECTAAAALL